jgi:hypothetical protein
VEGPCPKCRYTIRAPGPHMHPGFSGAVPGPAPVEPSPQRTANPPTSDTSTTPKKPVIPASVPIVPRVGPSQLVPLAEAAASPKEKLEPSGHREIKPKRSRDTKHIPKRILLRSMMPAIFAGITVLLIFIVMKVVKNKTYSSDPIPAPATTANGKATDQAGPTVPAGNTLPVTTSSTGSGTTNSAQPPPVDEAALRPSAATEALAVLEKFLKAPSLEVRLPMIETMESEGDLKDTVLASPLPPFRNLLIDSQETFSVEKTVDFYFTFEFINKDGSAAPQTVVVRRRGGVNPRVLVDPFLDLYGGRLAAFAAKPQVKGQLFHAIVYPLPSCNDLRIPDRHKKLTLKLYAHENSPNVTIAYASRVSQIGEMLTNGSYDLSYGKAKACVVLLGWNTKESPDAPYLEALDIKATHWNP